ncbi:MAG: DUF2269 domain-containing protein [Dehalococcoidia bacterium]|nr:DUF2269 domain-containing protein [Dehalococcoidia bacterium]
MELREVLLVLHILGAFVMAFGTGAGVLSVMAAGRSPDLRTIAHTTRLEAIAGRVASIAAVFVLALGIWLVIEADYEFSEAWLSASFLLFVIIMGVGGGVLSRHARRVNQAAEAALARGDTNDAMVQAEFAAPVARVGGAVILALYVAFVYLMVVKPGS